MKICFFSPYFYHKHAGGGERHILSIASYVASLGHHVDIAVSSLDQGSLSKKELKNYNNFYQNFTGLDLSKLNFIETPLFTSASFFSKLWWTKQYDYLYYASDGSLFFSLAGLNNLHIQIPFTRDLSFLDKLKLKNWHIINTNSEFTKSVIQKNGNIITL